MSNNYPNPPGNPPPHPGPPPAVPDQPHNGYQAQGNMAYRRKNPLVTNETKWSVKSTELWVYVLVSLCILIASAVVDDGEDGQGFGASQAWFYVTLLTIGYMLSRGLAKAGTRNHDDE